MRYKTQAIELFEKDKAEALKNIKLYEKYIEQNGNKSINQPASADYRDRIARLTKRIQIIDYVIESLNELDKLRVQQNNNWISVKSEHKPKGVYNGMSEDILIRCHDGQRYKYIIGFYDGENFYPNRQDKTTANFVMNCAKDWKYLY